MARSQVFARPHEVPHLESDHGSTVVIPAEQSLVDAALHSKGEAVVKRKDETDGAAGAVRMAVSSQIAKIGLHVVIPPEGKSALRADLIHNTQITLNQEIRGNRSVA